MSPREQSAYEPCSALVLAVIVEYKCPRPVAYRDTILSLPSHVAILSQFVGRRKVRAVE
jgi:hypothetical protein